MKVAFAVAAVIVAVAVLAFSGCAEATSGRGWAKRFACADTDGGINFDAAGTVTWRNHTFTDRCLNNRTLKEYFCIGGMFWHTFRRCDCADGACINATRDVCTQGYRTASCEDNQTRRMFVYRNCTEEWRNETCEFGCKAGKCADHPRNETCLPGSLPNISRCDGNWIQKPTMGESCSCESCPLDWVNVTYCDSGCLNGSCLAPAPKECLPRYQDSYKCDGNWTFRLYVRADCGEKWMRGHFCRYGCVDGQCNAAY